MEDLLRKLKIKLPELRGTHVFWDGPYHLDAKSYGVQFDGSIAEDHGGVPEYTPVTDIFQRDGLFAPIMDSASCILGHEVALISCQSVARSVSKKDSTVYLSVLKGFMLAYYVSNYLQHYRVSAKNITNGTS